MESFKTKISPLMPVLLLGYLETLRMAAFFAFEWTSSYKFFITALVVVVYSFTFRFKKPGKAKTLSGLTILTFTLLQGVVSDGIDIYSLLTITGINFVYGLIIFMITGFIVERSSAREIFFLGGFLLAAIAITSYEEIWPLIVLNFTFGVGLASQLHLLSLENDPRVRFPSGTGIKSSIWGSVFLVIVVFISLLNVIFPAAQSKTEGITYLMKFFGNAAERTENKFWDKLQKFEFTGTVPLEDTVVMSVQSPRASYWKGESLDFYTSRGWTNTMSVRPVEEGDFVNPFPPDAYVSKVVQKFNISSWSRSKVIFFGGTPAQINIFNSNKLSAGGEKMMTDNGGNFYIHQLQMGRSYEVVSYFADFNPQKSRQDTDSYPAEIEAKYLQLPEIPERVRSLAEQITESAQTPFEKAAKIEHYLSSNYPYDLTVKPAPANRDITDYFLFELKKGYCTYHSTAMVVMLRAAGIPARWVTGFTPGKYNIEKGVYEVKMSNAHAWVEAYIGGFGWVPFEPTSSFKMPVVPEKTISASVPSIKPPETGKQAGGYSTSEDRKSFTGIILVVLAAVSVTAIIILRRKPFSLSNTENMEQIYNLLLQLLAYRGHHKNAVQTPLEFAAQLVGTGDFNEDYADIMYITESYVRQRFGPGPTDGSKLDESRNALKRLARKWSIKTRD